MLKKMRKKTFCRAILEILLSSLHPIMEENMIWAKFTLNDVLIITAMIINLICNFQPFLYSAFQHAFLAQLKIKSLSFPYRKSKLQASYLTCLKLHCICRARRVDTPRFSGLHISQTPLLIFKTKAEQSWAIPSPHRAFYISEELHKQQAISSEQGPWGASSSNTCVLRYIKPSTIN